MQPLQFKEVARAPESKALKLIVFDSANFGIHLYFNLTSSVAYGNILISTCLFLLYNASKSNPNAS